MNAVFEAVPNFSEGRELARIARLSAAAGEALLDASFDADHNRLVLSLAGAAPALSSAAFAAVAAAVEEIDLAGHSGVHPRRGAADVVPFVALDGSLEEAAGIARAFGARVWEELRLPVHFYGAASAGTSPLTLAEIRSAAPPAFDLGSAPHPTAGSVAVGARPLLVAYNLVLTGVSLEAARALARTLRESAGGVPGVMALVFTVSAGVQLSMNLTRLAETPPGRAFEEAWARLPRGGRILSEEVVGLCPAAAAAGCPGADGKLLEARLAAAAARAAALLARSRPGEEMALLAARLEAEADSLGGIGFDDVLAGAERAAALRLVLRAGRVSSEAVDSLLAVAARGLFEAIPAGVRSTFPERLAALEPRLADGSEVSGGALS